MIRTSLLSSHHRTTASWIGTAGDDTCVVIEDRGLHEGEVAIGSGVRPQFQARALGSSLFDPRGDAGFRVEGVALAVEPWSRNRFDGCHVEGEDIDECLENAGHDPGAARSAEHNRWPPISEGNRRRDTGDSPLA